MLYWVESGIELKSGSGGGWMKQSTLVKFKHGLNNYIFNCFAYFEWLIFFNFWIKLKLLEDDLRLFSYALSQPTPFTVCCLGQYDSLLMKNQLSPSLYLKCILRTIVW